MLQKSLLLFNTVKYLKLSQILGRVKRKLIRPTLNLSNSPNLSQFANPFQLVVQCQAKMLDKNQFRFLNVTADIKTQVDWNSPNQDKLWLYNLHYFDDLNALDSGKRFDWHCHLIQRWVDENPPGFGNGWEAYPSSLRIVNWIKWSLLGNHLEQGWIESLAIQTRYLSNNLETHLLGNHLFANAKALVFAGLFFEGNEADNWYQIGLGIIEKELPEQILADGGNFELSPMYHAIFLEDLLDLVNIYQAYNKSLPSTIGKTIQMMFDWLEAMSHPDGEISFFNDAALGIAPSFEMLSKYAKRLNIKNTSTDIKPLTYLQDSGYIRVQMDDAVSIIDVASIGADYIPGHGHADTLSFELSLFGERVIVNSGTATYETGIERHQHRSTHSHSTVTIDEQNSSEVWGGFRVARRANVSDVQAVKDDNNIKVSACHDGYKKLKGKPNHCRKWHFSNRTLKVVDKITGHGRHKIKLVLPLHPKVKTITTKGSHVELGMNNKQINVEFGGGGMLKIMPSRYHQEFGLSIDNQQLVYVDERILPVEITTRISW